MYSILLSVVVYAPFSADALMIVGGLRSGIPLAFTDYWN